MGDERPSDSMQPSSKRRAAGQATKDDVDDEEEEQDQNPGEWRPVDPEVAKRRKVKVRRAGAAEPEPDAATAAPTSANPFAGIALAAPAPGANPFSGFNLVPPAAQATKTPAPAAEAVQPTAAAASNELLLAGEGGHAVEEPKAAAPSSAGKDKDATPAASTPGFGFYTGSNAFAALTSSSTPGSGFGSGFGGFGGFKTSTPNLGANDTPTTTPLFGSTPKSSGFSFGTGSFPPVASAPKPASREGEEAEEAGEEGNVEVFGECSAEFKPVVQLPDQKTVTGEEEERVAFTADSTLFEFDHSTNKWRERGKGEFRLNMGRSGQARMVMRQAGNYRLLLNAKVYVGMAVQKMASDVGVTFACANAAAPPEASTPEKKEGDTAPGSGSAASSSGVATWALKIKNKELVLKLHEMLTQLREAAPAVESAEDAV